jgi:hypothetical protein
MNEKEKAKLVSTEKRKADESEPIKDLKKVSMTKKKLFAPGEARTHNPGIARYTVYKYRALTNCATGAMKKTLLFSSFLCTDDSMQNDFLYKYIFFYNILFFSFPLSFDKSRNIETQQRRTVLWVNGHHPLSCIL